MTGQKPGEPEGGDACVPPTMPIDPHLQEYQRLLFVELQHPPKERDSELIQWLRDRIDAREQAAPPIKGDL